MSPSNWKLKNTLRFVSGATGFGLGGAYSGATGSGGLGQIDRARDPKDGSAGCSAEPSRVVNGKVLVISDGVEVFFTASIRARVVGLISCVGGVTKLSSDLGGTGPNKLHG
jgi:hypothetical protein